MRRRDETDHGPRDRLFDVDCRIVPGVCQRTGEDDVAVENRACRVGNRILLVVAFRQHGIEGGDRAAADRAIAGPLDELRQTGEYRWRIAAGNRRLADGKRDSRCAIA